ncbi:uncharacterized protein LOC116144624 [Pistacia vera]|uniref:uncharacterized protein LOC116144624 n=1 Tax=Pistacia vera TaxID=55513 RepID=UPI001262BBB7|nr:uncharacterized protein LOC116144624 [Pistacia vera]
MALQVLQEKLKNLWIGWEIRMLVLLSLSLQIILILFGSRRKYIAKSWIKIPVWLAYLAADSVATVALGNLATSQGDYGVNSQKLSHQLQVFWAPFLLLHLGGPDTITAYSLEDNELWLRHFLGLVVQVGVAFNVFIQSWSNNTLTFLAIPVFIAGVTKYGERTWVLWSSSTASFKDSLLLTLDPSPSLVKINMKGDIEDQQECRGSHDLLEAHFLFKRFSFLFAGLVLSNNEVMKSRKIFDKKSAEEAFNLVSIELGFMYDLLYTKAIVVYSRLGIFLRCITFLSSISALVLFSIFINFHGYPLTDICISYFLLLGAVVLEVYSFIQHFSSDWTKLIFLIKSKNAYQQNICGTSTCHAQSNHKRWSKSMGQFNLISFCLKEDISITSIYINGVLKLLGVRKFFEKYLHLTSKDVNLQLQEIVNSQILNLPVDLGKTILDRRGDYVLKEKYLFDLSDNEWFIVDREFDESLLTWHIAIDICYHQDLDKHGDNFDHLKCKLSTCISNYMLYLLIFCPSLMPKGNGELRFRDTCDEVTQFFESERGVIGNKKIEACKMLFQRKKEIMREDFSVVDSGCYLANDLQSLELKENWSCEKKWEMISEVCVEMLTYAANHCEWKEHGQQLAKAGELLTHVSLLMAHYGFSAQYDPRAWNIS